MIDAAVREHLDRMAHVMFGGLTHAGAIRLADRLAEWTGLPPYVTSNDDVGRIARAGVAGAAAG